MCKPIFSLEKTSNNPALLKKLALTKCSSFTVFNMKDLAYVTCEKSWLTLQLGAGYSTIRCCKIRSGDEWNHLTIL